MTPNGDWTPVAWRDLQAPAVLPLLGVEFVVAWIAAPPPVAAFTRVHDGDASVFRAEAPLPRVFARFAWDDEQSAANAGRRLRDGYPYRQRVLLDAPPPIGPPATADQVAASQVAATRRSPERIEIDANLAAPAAIVFMESFDPGWRVTVDGEAAVSLRAYGTFLAVAVDAGPHQVAFAYWPRGLTLGLILTGLGLVGLTAQLLWSSRRDTAAVSP